jgi:cell division protein ZipA
MMLRTILLIIGIIVILAIALDGWRRKHQRRSAILRTRSPFDIIPEETSSTTNEVAGQRSVPTLESPTVHIAVPQTHIPVRAENSAVATQVKSANEAMPKREPLKKRPIIANVPAAPSSVIMLTVMSANNQPFAGHDLIKILDEANLHFGEYDIYHRHKYKNGKGPLYFSVASVVKPGTLNPESIAAIATPGLALFMRMDNPKHDRITFKQMLATAHELARALGGVVCDDKRVPLREATLKFYSEKLNL